MFGLNYLLYTDRIVSESILEFFLYIVQTRIRLELYADVRKTSRNT
ncbi:hypothetical protein DSUL_60109 [Desulfovibrionales bacterium]